MANGGNQEQQRVNGEEEVTPHPAADIHVLVADDNSTSRRLMWVMLRRRGYAVSVADSGQRALESLRRKSELNAAIVEINLSDVDGYMVASSMRLEDPRRDLQLIALTRPAEPRTGTLALHAGFDHHLAMAFDPDELFGLLEFRAAERARRIRAALAAEEERSRAQSFLDGAVLRLGQRGWSTAARRFGPMADCTLEAIDAALRREDLRLVARLAHGFAGGAARLGLAATELLARELELCAIQRLTAQIPPLLLQLEASVADASDRVARVLWEP